MLPMRLIRSILVACAMYPQVWRCRFVAPLPYGEVTIVISRFKHGGPRLVLLDQVVKELRVPKQTFRDKLSGSGEDSVNETAPAVLERYRQLGVAPKTNHVVLLKLTTCIRLLRSIGKTEVVLAPLQAINKSEPPVSRNMQGSLPTAGPTSPAATTAGARLYPSAAGDRVSPAAVGPAGSAGRAATSARPAAASVGVRPTTAMGAAVGRVSPAAVGPGGSAGRAAGLACLAAVAGARPAATREAAGGRFSPEDSVGRRAGLLAHLAAVVPLRRTLEAAADVGYEEQPDGGDPDYEDEWEVEQGVQPPPPGLPFMRQASRLYPGHPAEPTVDVVPIILNTKAGRPKKVARRVASSQLQVCREACPSQSPVCYLSFRVVLICLLPTCLSASVGRPPFFDANGAFHFLM